MPAWAGLWDGVYMQPHALRNDAGSALRGVARLMAPQAMRAYGRIGDMLTGSVLGSVVQESIAQVVATRADGANLGGKVAIAPTVIINRVTTAQDEAILDAQLTPSFAPSPYPVDKSGNGGGGKLGTL